MDISSGSSLEKARRAVGASRYNGSKMGTRRFSDKQHNLVNQPSHTFTLDAKGNIGQQHAYSSTRKIKATKRLDNYTETLHATQQKTSGAQLKKRGGRAKDRHLVRHCSHGEHLLRGRVGVNDAEHVVHRRGDVVHRRQAGPFLHLRQNPDATIKHYGSRKLLYY
jgi:hypothetical protein